MTPADLAALIATWSPRLQQAFMSGIINIRDAAQIGVIAKMLEKGDFDGAIRAVGLDPVAFRALDATLGQSFEAGGNAVASLIPSARDVDGHVLRVLFDVRNMGAEAWLRDHSSTMVTQIVTDQRQAIRQHLTAGMQAGENPRDVALNLVGRIGADGKRAGGVLGLTASQEEWARRYAGELAKGDPNALTRTLRDKRFDRTVSKAIVDGKPIPAEMQAKMVAAYRNRALRYRAETIGRTEAMTSLHQSQEEAFRQAIDKGQVDARNVRKIWHSAADNRVRETHRALNGESVGLNDTFLSPSGARLRYPGDPMAPAGEIINCRCHVQYRVDHLANVPAPQKPLPIVPAAPTVSALAALDRSAKREVLQKGRADGNEHIAGYDMKTGALISSISSDKSSAVLFTPELITKLQDPANSIVLHHNHPRSTSLSLPDLQSLAASPGLVKVVAHGHDGSSYSATSSKPLDQFLYGAITGRIKKVVSSLIKERLIGFDAANQLHGHIVNSVLARLGFIDYDATLAGKTAQRYAESKVVVDSLIEEIVTLVGSL